MDNEVAKYEFNISFKESGEKLYLLTVFEKSLDLALIQLQNYVEYTGFNSSNLQYEYSKTNTIKLKRIYE